jgi:hypothetical protein
MRINKKIPDAIIEMLVGWKPGSDMFSTYQHAKSSDIDKALMQVYGIGDEQIKKQVAVDIRKLLASDPKMFDIIAKVLAEKGFRYYEPKKS